MARQARKKSSSNIYHLLMRGINRQNIFYDTEDYQKFLDVLFRYRDISGYSIYAYCLMNNHIHLLIKEGEEPLAKIMRRICGSFVYWYNAKYQRVGNLFQDRFKSEAVEDDKYFLNVLRYIHQNPLKAGLVKTAQDYTWSSMGKYISSHGEVNADYVFKYFSKNKDEAVERFKEFCEKTNTDEFLEMEVKKRTTDEEARNLITEKCRVNSPLELQGFAKAERDMYLRRIKEEGLSVRQIERLTSINRGLVLKA